MKNVIKIISAFYLLVLFLLPTAVFAESFICVGTCVDKTCTTYSSLPLANSKCVAEDGAPANACAPKAGECPASETNSSTVPKSPTKDKQYVTKLENPLVGVYSVTDILGNVIKVAMSVMGGAVLLMVIKGAVTWIDAGGSAEKVESGTKTIIWALIGAVLTVASYVILHGIIDAFFHPLEQ